MKLISLALLLVLAVAVSAQIGPEKSHSFQDGECNRNNNNCDWIVGRWKGFVTSRATSLRFFPQVDDRGPLEVNYPWATQLTDLWCTSRPYEIPYECTFGYSEEDDHLYQYCWFDGVDVDLCGETDTYVRLDNGELDTFFSSGFSTPAFFMTNRIVSLESGISFENLETQSFTGCLPYDVASKDLIIGNLWDGFSAIGSCSADPDDDSDFGPSPVLPASCQLFVTTTTTQSTSTTTTTTVPTTTTTTVSTTTTTTVPTTTTTTTTVPTTTTTTVTTTTTTTVPTTTTTTTTVPTTTTTTIPTTTTTQTTTHSTNPDAEYGCSEIYDGIDAVYGFELARVRPASFPFDSIDTSNGRCDSDNHCDCVRSSSDCNWLVGQWEGYLFAKGFNDYIIGDDDQDPPYPFPPTNDNVRCQWSESATEFQCSYYFNEETGFLNSHCWYDAASGYVNVGSGLYTTYAWEQWTEITSLNGGVVIGDHSANFLNDGQCIPMDRLDRDTFIQQFPDGFSSNPSCSSSPVTVFDCIDGFQFTNGNNNMFTLNYRIMDATWHDWDASSSLSPLIALSLLLAALLALF